MKKQIIENIDAYFHQALLIAKEKKFGLGITRVYFVGGTLCIDVKDGQKRMAIIMATIRTEVSQIVFVGDECVQEIPDSQLLLSIKSLKAIRDIYLIIRGKTEYLSDSIQNSVLRHFDSLIL